MHNLPVHCMSSPCLRTARVSISFDVQIDGLTRLAARGEEGMVPSPPGRRLLLWQPPLLNIEDQQQGKQTELNLAFEVLPDLVLT